MKNVREDNINCYSTSTSKITFLSVAFRKCIFHQIWLRSSLKCSILPVDLMWHLGTFESLGLWGDSERHNKPSQVYPQRPTLSVWFIVTLRIISSKAWALLPIHGVRLLSIHLYAVGTSWNREPYSHSWKMHYLRLILFIFKVCIFYV